MSSPFISRRRRRLGALGKRYSALKLIRSQGFPADMPAPLFRYKTDKELKEHPRYTEAKAGSTDAAISVVYDVAMPLINEAAGKLPPDLVYVAPHAIEATGDNAIPQVLAAALAVFAKGIVDEDIVQAAKVFHTGADPMERMNLRPFFDGTVIDGQAYVLVDDVSTMGGTLAELGNYIQLRGGQIAGVVVIVNASRSGTLYPVQKTVKLLERRFGNEIREIFGIEPSALTADEANYLIGFRSADEIRGRSTKAREETNLRLRAKGVLPSEDEQTRLEFAQRRRRVKAKLAHDRMMRRIRKSL
ncbi:phosphoribosyltransferase [Burkholderia pseudomallei]|uniref:phosphoribosyltransferase n=1 Tax=Burkholderia pseudomallei TaxID=28450 RepID=UPI001E3DB211|nr:phosphoribosyltransferase [Burkholderia pseudomallei]